MKVIITFLVSIMVANTAPPSELSQRVPLKLAHLAEIKKQDPQRTFRVRTPDTADVVAQISKVVLDSEGQRPKFAVLYLFDNVAQNRPQIVAPWEALSITPQRDEIFVNASVEQLKKIPVVTGDKVPDRAPENWGTEYYALYNVQPQQAAPEPKAAGTAALVSGVVKGSGSSGGEQSKAVVDLHSGNKTFLWVGIFLALFACGMLLRRPRGSAVP